MLMHAHDRGVDRRDPIQITGLLRERLRLLQHPRPHALLGPPVGSAEGLVESELYAAKATAFIIMASNSTDVSFPNLRCLRLR